MRKQTQAFLTVLCASSMVLAISNFQAGAANEHSPLKTNDPIEAALAAVRSQGVGFGRRREIVAENDALENPQNSVVTITEEGFADDSVRGHRYTLQLQKDADENWVVEDLQKFWVCQPGRGSQVYTQELCL